MKFHKIKFTFLTKSECISNINIQTRFNIKTIRCICVNQILKTNWIHFYHLENIQNVLGVQMVSMEYRRIRKSFQNYMQKLNFPEKIRDLSAEQPLFNIKQGSYICMCVSGGTTTDCDWRDELCTCAFEVQSANQKLVYTTNCQLSCQFRKFNHPFSIRGDFNIRTNKIWEFAFNFVITL